MPTAEIDIEIYCGTCGAGLCNQSTFNTSRNRGYPQFRVDVCADCLEKATDAAREEGWQKGWDDAQKEQDERRAADMEDDGKA